LSLATSHVFVTLRTEGTDGHTRPLPGLHRRFRLRWIICSNHLPSIVVSALFIKPSTRSLSIWACRHWSYHADHPIAGLPKFNSVLWIRSRKDTLALGNITGALVFQSTFPVSVGLLLTDWNLNTVSLVSACMALGSGSLLFLWMKLKHTLAWWMLLLGGAWYAGFVAYALAVTL
jgi:hypothetical protein